MRENSYGNVVCPLCKGPISVSDSKLQCGRCNQSYEIIDGVPNFLPKELFERYNTRLKQQDLDEEHSFYEKMYSNLDGVDDGHCVVYGYDEIYQFMNDIDKGTLLDVGCGAGHHSKDLAKLGFDVTGIDISINGINQAKKVVAANNQVAKFFLGDIENLPFADSTFDVVFCGLILHHFPKREKLFDELCRVCKSSFVAFEVNAYDPISFLRFDIINPTIGIKNITKNQRTVSPFKLKKQLTNRGYNQIKYKFVDVHHFIGRYPNSPKGRMLRAFKVILKVLPLHYRNNKFIIKGRK